MLHFIITVTLITIVSHLVSLGMDMLVTKFAARMELNEIRSQRARQTSFAR